MSIAFVCPSCGREFDLADNLVGKKARCKCGVVNVITAGGAPLLSGDDDLLGFRDEPEPTREAPPPVSVTSSRPVPPPVPKRVDAWDNGTGEIPLADEPVYPTATPVYAAAPPALPTPALPYGRPAPQPNYYDTPAGKSSGGGGGAWSKVGGVVFTILFICGIAAKAYFRATRSSSSNTTSSQASSVNNLFKGLVQAVPWSFSAPRATPNLPARVEPTVREGYLVAEAGVPNLAQTTTSVRVTIPQGIKRGTSVPCVFVGPAGSAMYHGMPIDDADYTDETLPYLQAGYAVVAFSVSGPIDEDDSEAQAAAATRAYLRSEAGLLDVRAAVDFVIARYPEINPSKLYIAGHSSAGSLALLAASKDPRFVACAAYAPCTDVSTHLAEMRGPLQNIDPRFMNAMAATSPDHLQPLCRTLVFQALDDETVLPADSQRYAQSRPLVTLVQVPSGGHYDSMIEHGIAEGIKFFKSK